MKGTVATIKPELSGDFAVLMGWADGVRRMKVRANAETPLDARVARAFGAEGIGLCRTEHMFFDADRIVAMREMILSDNEQGGARRWPRSCRCSAPISSSCSRSCRDCRSPSGSSTRRCTSSCRRAMPRSRTSPNRSGPIRRRCAAGWPNCTSSIRCWATVAYGWRYPIPRSSRCRPGPSSKRRRSRPPDRGGADPRGHGAAGGDQGGIRAGQEAHRGGGRRGAGADGQAPELPRRHHDRASARRPAGPARSLKRRSSFSFGTNDLTQTTFGISRDDSARFLGDYAAKGILAVDPFVSLDIDGVGELVRIAVARGRAPAPGHQARHLRRAWRRSGLDPVL